MSEGLTILAGDCRETLKTLPAKSVHCVVTSPPYWGLRDYGVDGQIGLEKSVDEFVAQLVAVFAEVWRVLRDDGTCWLNLGDTYASEWACGRRNVVGNGSLANGKREARPNRLVNGLKEKDLVGLPWRVAFALQAAGWYLRSDIIWHKPNPMPESVTDRPTKAHEYIFLLTKSPRYFYDAEAIKESSVTDDIRRPYASLGAWQLDGRPVEQRPNGKPRGRGGKNAFRGQGHFRTTPAGAANRDGRDMRDIGIGSLRNRRSVWKVATTPFKGAHFATFPAELIRPCILAGSSAGGCCAVCGTPVVRVIEKGEPDREHQRACGGNVNGEYHGKATKDYARAKAQDASATKARILAGMVERRTVGWVLPDGHDEDCPGRVLVPCTVLDPFGGAFTTAYVALQEKRRAIMCELNADYIALGQERCRNVQPPKVKPARRVRPAPEQLSLLSYPSPLTTP